jgi:hypothetical protein
MSDTEFLIHEVRVEAGIALVSGIVNKGAVPIGASFTSVKRATSEVSVVHLLVKKIVAYRREIETLPAGMSGELTLEGQGMEVLRKHDMLEM